MKNPIYLIGYMCSGKSTLGRALAHRLGWEFIDLDEYIENLSGMSVTEIFNSLGQDAFRKIETETLRKLIDTDNRNMRVIAVGGGTPCFNDNIGLMNMSGLTVFLEAPVERLVERLILGQETRPLVAGKKPDELYSFVENGLKSRLHHYMKAQARFDASELENERMIAGSVDKFIQQIINHDHDPRNT